MKRIIIFSLLTCLVIAIISAVVLYRKAPSNKVEVTSTLIMLGDLDGDNSWSRADQTLLNKVIAKPYNFDVMTRYKIDVNKNGRIDPEDLRVLASLFAEAAPYKAEVISRDLGLPFPRPRELFTYLPDHDYLQPPIVLLPNDLLEQLPVAFARELRTLESGSAYQEQLIAELRDELTRFTQIYLERRDSLSEVEQHYLNTKFNNLEQLYQQGNLFELLLAVIGLVEDGETLHYEEQDPFVRKILYFRNDLREILNSTEMDSFNQGKATHMDIYRLIEQALKKQLDIDLDLATLGSPRDFTQLENYLDRIEWQKQKNAVTEEQFKRLILYAQHDRRYLRTVSRTNPKHQDLTLENHNLPMVLLFREALHIMGGDKKAAVALLDEALRIPLGWVKSIPKEYLPKSLALENFLLPGNKEDGADKSRHWNVFGGISIYKSPEEALTMALKRESKDLKESDYSAEAMREFIRDTIANINGIYHVHSLREQ